jgi:hypothetical protein
VSVVIRAAMLLVVGALLSLPGAPPVRAQSTATIEGLVTNGTAGGAAPADLEIVVHILQNRVKTGEQRVRTDASGAFRIEGLAAGTDILYFPIVQYGGIPYYPDRPVVLDGSAPGRADITVFESTPRADAIAFERLNMLVMDVTPTALSFMEMGAVTNGGDRTFAADPQVTGSARTLRFLLPPGAMQVTPQAGLPADSLESMPDGFASTDPVRPGRREIAYSYELPYTSSSLDLSRSFAFPVSTFTLYVPADVGVVVPDGIAVPGVAELGGRQYRQYVVQQVAPGAEVRLRLTGLPAPLFARPRDLGVAVAAVTSLVLLACVLVAIWRRRGESRGSLADREPSPVADSSADPAERQALVRDIALLDEQFASGALDEPTYRAQRDERKARLLALSRASAAAS